MKQSTIGASKQLTSNHNTSSQASVVLQNLNSVQVNAPLTVDSAHKKNKLKALGAAGAMGSLININASEDNSGDEE